jgi:hypothetical protein
MSRLKTRVKLFAAKAASPVITGTAVSFASVHIAACARIRTHADAADAKENYAAIEHDFWGNGSRVPGEALSTPKKPIKSALKTGIKSLRGWRWDESIEGHRLLDRKGRMAACIEGGGGNGGWRIIHPGAHPVPQPVSNLETAKRQAETVALWALPLDEKTAARQRAANKLTIDPADFENAAAIFQRNSLPLDLLGGYPFESAPALEQKLVKTIVRMESRLGEPLPSVPSPPLVPTESLSPMLEAEDPLAIPEFLTRPFPHR